MLKKFLLEQVPGHVRAYTWALALVAGAMFYNVTENWKTALAGAVLTVLGEFLGNQATHLDQENHQGMRASWLERQLTEHTLEFQILGIGAFALGI